MTKLNTISLNEYSSITLRALVLVFIALKSKKSLTKKGITAALLTGFVHSLPPSNLYLALIVIFYLSSSKCTKYKEDIKALRTKVPKSSLENKSDSNSHSQRTHVQVLSNSIVASVLILISTFSFDKRSLVLLKAGIIGQYVAVQADTWSSELGILSKSKPFLITSLKTVPHGTNGGVTYTGLFAGIIGAAVLSFTASLTYDDQKLFHFIYFTGMGLIGTLIDSLLGSFLQSSFVDERDGLILEPIGGVKVETEVLRREGDKLTKISGEDILSNNQVNIAMAVLTSLLSIIFYQVLF